MNYIRRYLILNSQNILHQILKKGEEYSFEKEEYVYKKYENEIKDLKSWILNIKYSIKEIDGLIEKGITKIDKPIEIFFYILPFIFYYYLSLLLL